MNGSPSMVPEVDEPTTSDLVKDLFSRPDDSSLWDPTRTGAGLPKCLPRWSNPFSVAKSSQAQMGMVVQACKGNIEMPRQEDCWEFKVTQAI